MTGKLGFLNIRGSKIKITSTDYTWLFSMFYPVIYRINIQYIIVFLGDLLLAELFKHYLHHVILNISIERDI